MAHVAQVCRKIKMLNDTSEVAFSRDLLQYVLALGRLAIITVWMKG
jgi:hypothetical protein